ncbi:MAG: hypothetical protein WCE68_01885 [Anaerolineales bacterium]
MINPVRGLTSLYAKLIRLFPPQFQCDFGEELQIVFHSRAKEAIQTGGALALVGVCAQELHDLPGNILHEHLDSLRKAFKRGNHPGLITPARSAGRGALGFGLGFGLLIVLRWLLDPQNDIMFTNVGAGLIRETLLFSLMATLGWVMIGLSAFPRTMIKKVTVTSSLLGAAGGFLATTFVNFSFNYFSARLHSIPFLGMLIQFTGALIYGAFFGAVFGFLGDWRARLIPMAVCGSACFGISFLISEEAFRLFYLLPFSLSWRLEFWAIPLAASAAIEGLIAGAFLGWMVGREKPPKPAWRAAITLIGNDQSIFEGRKNA